MRKSTDYAVGGGGFLSAGSGIVGANLINLYEGSEGLLFGLAILAFGSIFLAIGAWWTWKSIGFRHEEDLAPTVRTS